MMQFVNKISWKKKKTLKFWTLEFVPSFQLLVRVEPIPNRTSNGSFRYLHLASSGTEEADHHGHKPFAQLVYHLIGQWKSGGTR